MKVTVRPVHGKPYAPQFSNECHTATPIRKAPPHHHHSTMHPIHSTGPAGFTNTSVSRHTTPAELYSCSRGCWEGRDAMPVPTTAASTNHQQDVHMPSCIYIRSQSSLWLAKALHVTQGQHGISCSLALHAGTAVPLSCTALQGKNGADRRTTKTDTDCSSARK